MTLFGTRRQAIPEPTVELPALRSETCTACGATGPAMHKIAIPEYGAQWVCVDPAPCRQYAQLSGVYGNPGGASWR